MGLQVIISFLSGIAFAVGLSIAGMTKPSKVQGFLDITGQWDYSLAFVMIGGILIHTLSYLVQRKTKKPLLADSYQVPTNRKIDKDLIIGGAIFGAGWGLAGFCPGPALTALTSGGMAPVIFVASMTAGMLLFDVYQKIIAKG